MRSTRGRLPVLAAVALLLLAGCATQPAQDPGPSEAALQAAIEEIDGVTAASVHFSEEFPIGSGYVGDVYVDGEADPLCVLDTVWAILWQGRSTSVNVIVHQGEEETDWLDGDDFPVGEIAQFEARYGPRPAGPTVVTPEPPPYCD